MTAAGRFDTEGYIIFDERPRNPWEFMATGIGVTGIALTVDRSLKFQLTIWNTLMRGSRVTKGGA